MKGIILEIVCSKIHESYKLLSKLSVVKEAQTFGDRLNIVVKKSEHINEVKKTLIEEGIELIDIRKISPSLENIFISLVKAS
jgi:hypothetical protein